MLLLFGQFFWSEIICRKGSPLGSSSSLKDNLQDNNVSLKIEIV